MRSDLSIVKGQVTPIPEPQFPELKNGVTLVPYRVGPRLEENVHVKPRVPLNGAVPVTVYTSHEFAATWHPEELCVLRDPRGPVVPLGGRP